MGGRVLVWSWYVFLLFLLKVIYFVVWLAFVHTRRAKYVQEREKGTVIAEGEDENKAQLHRHSGPRGNRGCKRRFERVGCFIDAFRVDNKSDFCNP